MADYFPNRGLISLVVVMKDGKTAEAGIVGKEGFTGTPAAVGLSRSPLQAVVQITGDGFRVAAGALQNTLESAPHLQLILSRYAAIRGMQVAQTAGCNRLHDIGQRLARWLLMTQDRVDSGSLPITHDFLATMLGTDVTVLASQPSDNIPTEITFWISRFGQAMPLLCSPCAPPKKFINLALDSRVSHTLYVVHP